MSGAFYPEMLANLYRPEGITYKMKYNQKMWEFVALHRQRKLTEHEKAYLAALDSVYECNLLAPGRAFLEGVEALFDLIAVSLIYSSKRITKTAALMELYSPESPVREGTGKTGLALAVIGASIPYNEIPRPQSRYNSADAYSAIAELGRQSLSPIPFKNTNVRLVASDLTYVGVGEDRKLCIAPAVGEPFIAQWDMARHISRVYDVYYKERDGRTIPWLKDYLIKLAEKYYLEFGVNGAFNDPFSLTRLDELYIIEPHCRSGTHGVLAESETRNVLETLLLRNPVGHPAYPSSGFWKLYEDEHEKRVRKILNNLAVLPRIRRFGVAKDTRTNFQETAALLKEALEDA